MKSVNSKKARSATAGVAALLTVISTAGASALAHLAQHAPLARGNYRLEYQRLGFK